MYCRIRAGAFAYELVARRSQCFITSFNFLLTWIDISVTFRRPQMRDFLRIRCAHVGLVNRDIVKRSLRSFLFMGRGNRIFLMKIFYTTCPLIRRFFVFLVESYCCEAVCVLLLFRSQDIRRYVTWSHVITVDSIYIYIGRKYIFCYWLCRYLSSWNLEIIILNI